MPDLDQLEFVFRYLEEIKHQLRDANYGMEQYSKIQAIKNIRAYFGMGLEEAKNLVDWIEANPVIVENMGLIEGNNRALLEKEYITIKSKMDIYVKAAKEVLERYFGEAHEPDVIALIKIFSYDIPFPTNR